MKPENRDLDILSRIVGYCDEIFATSEYFAKEMVNFAESVIYRNACAMSLLQIGELVGALSDEFKAANNFMPWKSIKGMRNIIAHRYGSISSEMVWETVTEDIPSLHKYCSAFLYNDIKNTGV